MKDQKAALLSVSNKDGLVPFARELHELGYTLLCTSGSGRLLKEENIPFLSLEEYTGQREILGGRVKTLHPKIHAGILAKRQDSEHMQELSDNNILPIDLVIVNLYPFEENRSGQSALDPTKMVEQVDIGGPTMIRAAAKNFEYVYPVIDPKDYSAVIEQLKLTSQSGKKLRLEMARKVFAQLAAYNLLIAEYFSYVGLNQKDQFEIDLDKARSESFKLGRYSGFVGMSPQALRYGENPHQVAAFYRGLECGANQWEKLQGKELSYNNLLDADACLSLLRRMNRLDSAVAIIVKHLNPCGAAIAQTPELAIQRAKLSDTRSHFGGIIGLTTTVDAVAAKEIVKDFSEIVIAPAFDDEALAILASKKNLRVLKISSNLMEQPPMEFRSALDGMLCQSSDANSSCLENAELVAGEPVSQSVRADLEFAWQLCASVRSNAIAITKEKLLLGVGAGQMSRIDSVEFSIWKANAHGHDLRDSVAASDAFFPFPDGVERLAAEGIKAVVTPMGSLKDQEIVESAKSSGLTLYFMPDRHFRH